MYDCNKKMMTLCMYNASATSNLFKTPILIWQELSKITLDTVTMASTEAPVSRKGVYTNAY